MTSDQITSARDVAVAAAIAHADSHRFWWPTKTPHPVTAALDEAGISPGPHRDEAIAAAKAAHGDRAFLTWPWRMAEEPEDCEKCSGTGFAVGREEGPACSLCGGDGTIPTDAWDE